MYVAAIRNRNLHLPEDPTELYEIDHDNEAVMEVEFLPHSDIFRFYPNIDTNYVFFFLSFFICKIYTIYSLNPIFYTNYVFFFLFP